MKVAVVGCGGIGKTHARAYQSIPGVELIYMIDRVPELAAAAAREFGARPLTSLSEMREKPDAVSVVTPPMAHYEPIMALLERGISVFSEKPLSMDARECERIVELSERSGVQVGVGFKMRGEPVFEKARERIGAIGEIYAVSAVKNQPYNPRPNGWVPSVGCMYELSVHEYDLIEWIAGIESLSVRAELVGSMGWEREDRAFLDVNYSRGVKGRLISVYSPDTRFTFSDLAITYVGSRGYMRVERPDRIFLHTHEDEIIAVEPQDNTRVFAKELGAFLRCLKTGERFSPGAREGARMTWLIEAARESSRSGEYISVRK